MRSTPKTGERALIEALKSRTGLWTSSTLRLGIGDDCAVLRPPKGHDLAVTTDLSLEGRHFRRDTHTPESAGHRCLARGLSDIAAMGATPLAAFLSLALPAGFHHTAAGRGWTSRFLDGLLALAEEHRTPLAGGDTAAAPENLILADIVLLGTVPAGRELRRSAARPGDAIFVTGALGGAAAELQSVLSRPRRYRRAQATGDHPHLFPRPRLAAGRGLMRRGLAHACIDLSDGLSTDLQHLCDESGVSAVIDEQLLPIHAQAIALGTKTAALKSALHGGEDYELLFTADPRTPMPKVIAGTVVTRIGEIVRGRAKMHLRTRTGRLVPLKASGWEHRF